MKRSRIIRTVLQTYVTKIRRTRFAPILYTVQVLSIYSLLSARPSSVQYVPLPDNIKAQLKNGTAVEMEICCKAIDGDFNVQPERMTHGWNVLGICVNHWSRVQVKLCPTVPPGEVKKAPCTPKPGSPYWGDGTPNRA